MASVDWSGKAATYLNLGADATSTRGALLAALGDAVQSQIEQAIGRTLDAQEWTEVYDGNGRTALVLRHDPVLSVASLSVNGSAVTVGDPTAPSYPPATVVIVGQQALRYTNGDVFPAGFGNVIVTYSAGFAVPPPALVQAGVQWIALLFKDRDRAGLTSENVGGQTNSFNRDMPPFVKAVCDKWTRWGIPA